MSKSKQGSLQEKQASSTLFGGNSAYLEEQYELYLQDPSNVSAEWQAYFKHLPQVNGNTAVDLSHAAVKDYFMDFLAKPGIRVAAEQSSIAVDKQAQVVRLIDAYRSLGHRLAKLDPLGFRQFPPIPALQLSSHGLSDTDLNTTFATESFDTIGKKQATLADICQSLQAIYCQSLGIEYMYIADPKQVRWVQQYLEPTLGNLNLNKEESLQVLTMLTAAEGLERYLATRFVGQKRFSLEGGDSFIPLMQELVQHSAKQGIKEIAIGMAHRGRLNLLVNILGKAPAKLFEEFEGKYDQTHLSGDVKYHKGYSSSVQTDKGIVQLLLGFNPSHLEIVAPVVEGAARARQERLEDKAGKQVLPVIVHGDAAFSGQGVVMETFALSQAEGYQTGGTIHIVINNQIGFTTNHPLDSKRFGYSTDIAKMVEAPIIHVNGDDPDAVIFAARLAMDFRNTFDKDVVIDLVCYRRLGHNEADEPMMTQPVVYQAIKARPTALTLYTQQLISKNMITAEEAKAMSEAYRNALTQGQPVVKLAKDYKPEHAVDWTAYWGTPWDAKTKTAVPVDVLQALGERVNTVPAGFTLQPQVAKELEARRAMMAGQQPLHWGMAETLAYASLVQDNYGVRLCGQDSGRGTFSHRHAVLHDMQNDKLYLPLQHISDDQAPFHVYDTILSEEAVLAFEYGYASTEPSTLTIWEAQFGDFYNGAQVVVDQFISSSEQKWSLLCGLVLFLPHGLEAMGPEHSSARIERFLQLCAQENMQVVVPTTPAQCFHLLRRQMLRNYRKPLIVMTPKSFLRHKQAVSTLDDLSKGEFLPVITETDSSIKDVKKVIITSGKVYYDLLQERAKQQRTDIAIIRIEQLYPVPEDALKAALKPYHKVKNVVWCQEEAENQGAWTFYKDKVKALLTDAQQLSYAGRPEAAAPAVGMASVHNEQHIALLEQAFR